MIVWIVERKQFGLAQLFLQECQNCRLRVQRNFSRNFLWEKSFSISSGLWAEFFWFFEEVCWLETHICLLSVSFQRNSRKNFFYFSEFWQNFFQFLSKTFRGSSKLHSVCLNEPSEKVGTKIFFHFFSDFVDNYLWYVARFFQQECLNCTLCPREASNENSFFPKVLFVSHFRNFSDFFPEFPRNFLARL